MKKQILIAGVFLSSLIIGCTQDEALETLSNESSLGNEIKKVETLFADNMQKEKNEALEVDEGEKLETSMPYEDKLVYYDYINRNGVKTPTPPMKTSSREALSSDFGLVLKPKGVRCYPYNELILVMDCEDHRERSYVSGNTGETFVDGNGNVHFFFCVVPKAMTRIGGLEEKRENFTRFFDCEDSDNDNRLYLNGWRVYYLDYATEGIKGDGRGNITFFFNVGDSNWHDGFGRFGTTSDPARNGIIHTDDEDDNNINSYGFPPPLGPGGYPTNMFETLDHNTTMKVYF